MSLSTGYCRKSSWEPHRRCTRFPHTFAVGRGMARQSVTQVRSQQFVDSAASTASLFEPSRNCWRVARASRAACLIDASAYFRAFVEAANHAERSILITGWDFHSRTRLLCGDDARCELELG